MELSRGSALRNYIIRRGLLMIPTIMGITLVTFLICQFVPGGPIDQIKLQLAGGSEGESGPGAARSNLQLSLPDDQMLILKQYYGFDKPVLIRYLSWLKNLATFNLGDSFRYTVPVMSLIKSRLPVSIFYGVLTTILTYVICIPLGILKAIKHRTTIDNLSSILIFIGYAIPGFALGALLLVLFAVKKSWFPLGGFVSENFASFSFWAKMKDIFHHAVLPIICYMIGSFAVMTMLMKNSLMENMASDYVKTALAKGLSWKRAVFVHAFRNSLIPLATSFGNNISLILTGSVLIERVFNIKGIGLLVYESIVARDYPVVLGMIVIGSLLLLVGNLLSDLCVAFVDPRVRFE
ncbi:ABC transporter permease subunit [Candidatus Sumerlaeota bacterium]|nr:ABC transporter permease subunit [Candidatus Sumerlaeota bacterium]